MRAAPAIQLSIRMDDRELEQLITRLARAWNVEIKETSRRTFAGMLRQSFDIVPPAHGGVTGKAAQVAGERALSRDLSRMGFEPVQIKGFRNVTTVFGHKLAQPVRVKTRENPKFADPDAIHRGRIGARHGGKVTRGGKQAWYVSSDRFRATFARLKQEIGRLASGFVRAADALGVAAPAWIRRHGGNRGTELQIIETPTQYVLRVVNHFPESAGTEAAATLLRIEKLKQYSIEGLKRQLKHKLKR